MANVPIQNIVFVVDGFWAAGNQTVELYSVTVNNNEFTFGGGAPTPTCTLPTATIDVQATPGSGLIPIDEAVYNLPADNTYFRVADCQYIYNLSTKIWLPVSTRCG